MSQRARPLSLKEAKHSLLLLARYIRYTFPAISESASSSPSMISCLAWLTCGLMAAHPAISLAEARSTARFDNGTSCTAACMQL